MANSSQLTFLINFTALPRNYVYQFVIIAQSSSQLQKESQSPFGFKLNGNFANFDNFFAYLVIIALFLPVIPLLVKSVKYHLIELRYLATFFTGITSGMLFFIFFVVYYFNTLTQSGVTPPSIDLLLIGLSQISFGFAIVMSIKYFQRTRDHTEFQLLFEKRLHDTLIIVCGISLGLDTAFYFLTTIIIALFMDLLILILLLLYSTVELEITKKIGQFESNIQKPTVFSWLYSPFFLIAGIISMHVFWVSSFIWVNTNFDIFGLSAFILLLVYTLPRSGYWSNLLEDISKIERTIKQRQMRKLQEKERHEEEAMQFLEYQGISLFKSECEFLKELEPQLNTKIMALNAIGSGNFGFVARKNSHNRLKFR